MKSYLLTLQTKEGVRNVIFKKECICGMCLEFFMKEEQCIILFMVRIDDCPTESKKDNGSNTTGGGERKTCATKRDKQTKSIKKDAKIIRKDKT